MNGILSFLLLVVQILPLLVIGVIIISAAYICFVYHPMRSRRLQMGASFVVGILAFAIAIVLNAQASQISWAFSDDVPPFSFPGYLLYGAIGLALGYGVIGFIRLAFKKNFPQFLVASLVGMSSFALFYYLFANETTSRTISILSLGMLIGILVRVMTINEPIRDLIRNT